MLTGNLTLNLEKIGNYSKIRKRSQNTKYKYLGGKLNNKIHNTEDIIREREKKKVIPSYHFRALIIAIKNIKGIKKKKNEE